MCLSHWCLLTNTYAINFQNWAFLNFPNSLQTPPKANILGLSRHNNSLKLEAPGTALLPLRTGLIVRIFGVVHPQLLE